MNAKTFTAAALLAAAPLAHALGQSVVHNSCQQDVFYMVSGAEGVTPTTEKLSPGGRFSMEYKNLNGAGVAIFLSIIEKDITDYTLSNSLTRLEYTYNQGALWYDVSNIDQQNTGQETSTYPFEKWGFSLTNSDTTCGSGSNSLNCGAATCSPGPCEHAYKFSSDDQTSMRNGLPEHDIILELCNASGHQSGYTAPSAPGSGTQAKAEKLPASKPSTTLATIASSTGGFSPNFDEAGHIVTVTHVATAVQTQVVTGAPKAKRHEHQHRHRHAHHADQA